MTNGPSAKRDSPGPERQELVVVRSAGDWRLYRNGNDAGRFDYKVDAVDAALRLATKIHETGRTVDVKVQDAAGQLSSYVDRPVWP